MGVLLLVSNFGVSNDFDVELMLVLLPVSRLASIKGIQCNFDSSPATGLPGGVDEGTFCSNSLAMRKEE